MADDRVRRMLENQRRREEKMRAKERERMETERREREERMARAQAEVTGNVTAENVESTTAAVGTGAGAWRRDTATGQWVTGEGVKMEAQKDPIKPRPEHTIFPSSDRVWGKAGESAWERNPITGEWGPAASATGPMHSRVSTSKEMNAYGAPTTLTEMPLKNYLRLELAAAFMRPADFSIACEFFRLLAARYYHLSNRSTQNAIYADAMALLHLAEQFCAGERYWTVLQQRAALKAVQEVEHLLLHPRTVELPDGTKRPLRHPKDLTERIPMLQKSLCVFAAALHEAEERMVSMSEGEAEVDPRHGWRHLPPELLYEVFSILSLADLLTVNSVCKFWKSVSRDDSLYRRHFLATRQRLGLTREAWAGGWREGLATMGRASGSCLLLTDLGTVEWAVSRSRTKGREISAAEALEHIVTKF